MGDFAKGAPASRSMLLRGARTCAQGYLAYEGCMYLAKQRNSKVDDENPSSSDDESGAEVRLAKGIRTGWFFIAMNLADEVAVILNRGGADEHLHHLACAGSAVINMAVLRSTKQRFLRDGMLDAFHVLLANEIVTPAFNLYAILKSFGRNHGLTGFVVLGSLLPLLRFRFANSCGLLRRL